jgi:hypothetical protein
MVNLQSDTRNNPAAGRRSDSCGSWLWCSPPRLPADTLAKRVADRLMPRGGWQACLFFLGVAALWAWSGHLGGRPALVIAGLASLSGGAWCSVNFWRCRHAHCLVTGAGWLILGVFAAAEVLLGHSVIGNVEGAVFSAILAAGVLFEAGWYFVSGTHAVTSHATPAVFSEARPSARHHAS